MFSVRFVTIIFIFFFIVLHHFSSPSSHSSPIMIGTFDIIFHHHIPISFLFNSPKSNSKFHNPRLNLFISLLILLAGDVELNPGPFNICTYNIRSLTNPLHYTFLSSLATDFSIYLFCLTETWISPNTTNFELNSCRPPNFSLYSFPRPAPSKSKSVIGGGTAFLLHNSCSVLSTSSHIYKSFELSSITFKSSKSKLTVHNVYRPPPSSSTKSRKFVSFSQFLSDFSDLLSSICTTPHDFIITGDFNIHVNDLSNSDTIKFLSLLSSHNLSQYVNFPTHISSKNTLDLFIAPSDSSLNPTLSFSPTTVSDHLPVLTSVSLSRPPPLVLVTRFFRCLKSINLFKFQLDISSSTLITNPPSSLSELVSCYNNTLSSLLDKHAPLKSKIISQKPDNPWFTPALHNLKSSCRRLHRIWSSSHSATDLSNLRTASNHYHAAILKAKRTYYNSLITSNKSNPKILWNTIINYK